MGNEWPINRQIDENGNRTGNLTSRKILINKYLRHKFLNIYLSTKNTINTANEYNLLIINKKADQN